MSLKPALADSMQADRSDSSSASRRDELKDDSSAETLTALYDGDKAADGTALSPTESIVPELRPIQKRPTRGGFRRAGSGASHIDDVAPMGRRATSEQQAEIDHHATERQIGFDENDPGNPLSWSVGYRRALTLLVCVCTINATLPSACPSAAIPEIAATFGVSTEVAELTTSFFLLGYVAGPLVWGPASESIGRRPFFIASMLLCCVFQLGGAISTASLAALLVTRFLSGCAASAPLTLSGAVISDCLSPIERGAGMCFFCSSVFLGALIAPSIGGFIKDSYLGWRWIFWIQMIYSGACLVGIVFLPETYGPVLLMRRARQLRKADPLKYEGIFAPLERADNSLRGILTRTVFRPVKMLGTEPILVAVTLYLAIIYGLLYGLFSALPLIFSGNHGWSTGIAGLVFLAIALGATGAAYTNYLIFRRYRVLVPKWHGSPPPEQRLYGCMIGGPVFVVSAFMLAWTSFPSVSPAAPIVALVLMGYGFTNIFLLTFLIDTYTLYAASALSANTIVRSGVAAAFPLFTTYQYERMGIPWATSLFGFVGILLVPIPFVFFRYGARVRNGSGFAPCTDLKIRDQVEREERAAAGSEKRVEKV